MIDHINRQDIIIAIEEPNLISATGLDGFPAIHLKNQESQKDHHRQSLLQSFLATGKLPSKLKERENRAREWSCGK